MSNNENVANAPLPPAIASIADLIAPTKAPEYREVMPATSSPTLTGAADTGPIGSTTTAQKPSLRRMVSYFENCRGKLEDRAAMIVKVHDDGRVNLVVFDEDGAYRAEIAVEQGDTAGSWNWPPRV